MADFFKGLTGGFQSGLQLGQAIRDRNMRDELAQAYAKPEEYTDYTPEQQRQIQGLQAAGGYDVQAVPGADGQAPTLRYTAQPNSRYYDDSGNPEAPIEIAPQRVQRYGGQTVAGQFDPAQLQGLQMREAARIVGANGDPARAAQMQAEATRMDREAKEAPLRFKGLEQQVALGGAQLTTAERANRIAEGNELAMNDVAELRSNNMPITSQSLAQIAKKRGADYNTLISGELNQIGFNKETAAAEMKTLSRDWSKAVLGGAPAINKFLTDKFDPDKSDNITPELIQTKAGFVVKYGDKILNEYGTHKDLNTLSAQVHGMINDDPLGTLKTLAAVRASNASANLHEAEAGLIPAKAGLLAEQSGYYRNIKGQNPTMMVNAKGEPTPVVMSDLPRENGVVKLPTGLSFPKDAQQATALEARAFESLTKSDAWQAAERKNDIPKLNELMVNRGIDPAKHGMTGAGAAPWKVATGPAAVRPASPVVPAAGPFVGDEDYRNVPTRGLSKGFSTPDARSVLRTPSYGSGMRAFNPED